MTLCPEMTREEKITFAVRKWLHIFKRETAEADAGRYGATKAIARQRLFVKCVRNTFRQMSAE